MNALSTAFGLTIVLACNIAPIVIFAAAIKFLFF